MEIFKTDILKKEFEKFQKENLVEIWKCGYCQKTSCQFWHPKFLVSCKCCREAFCKACHNFDIAKESILKTLDPIGKEYIENFIKNFFCISSETIQTNFQVREVVCVPIEKLLIWKVTIKGTKTVVRLFIKNLIIVKKLNTQ